MNPWDIQKLEDLLVFHCPECNAIEKSREVFLNHALTKHENAKEFLEKFMQDEDYKYLIKDELQVKSEIDEEEEYFENYEDNFVNEPQIEIRNTNEKFCEWCSLSFRNDFYLNYHIKTIHQNETQDLEKDKHDCDFCGKSFPNKKVLKTHIQIAHDSKSEINNDGSAGERIKCEHCHRTFKHINGLNIHMAKMHDGSKSQIVEEEGERITCEHCQKTFKNIGGLHMHLAKRHKELVKPASTTCPFENCGKVFGRERSLKDHIRFVHEKEKNSICDTCGKAYQTSTHLKIHHRVVHEGQANYVCKVCGKRYTNSGGLAKHVDIVSTFFISILNVMILLDNACFFYIIGS